MKIFFRMPAHADRRCLAILIGRHVEVSIDGDGVVWLRLEPSGGIDQVLARLPGERLESTGDQRLRRPGQRVATISLPDELLWQRLDDHLQLQLPAALLAGRLDASRRRTLHLVADDTVRDIAAVIVDRDDLRDWVDGAAEVRLRRLRIVVRDRDVLVVGDPLPPIDGEFFVATKRLLVPAGQTWSPPIDADSVRSLLKLRSDDWLLWQADADVAIIPDGDLSPLRRASFRAIAGAATR